MLKLIHEGAGEMFYATHLSAGFDICANEALILRPNSWSIIKTGLRIIDASFIKEIKIEDENICLIPELQIRPRSGLAAKFGITVLNAPSTVDADYRGEICINLINHGKENFIIEVGDRIAQGVCAFVMQLNSFMVRDVQRGTQGFGSTGR